MRTINIETLEFPTVSEASESKNYPHSGLFIARTKDGFSDLRLVDKSVKNTFCICPESIFNAITINLEHDFQTQIEETVSPKYDGDFILEFSRILLNRK